MEDQETFHGIYACKPFNVFFYGDRVYIGETEYPLGQCVVDVMNLDDTCLLELDRRMLDVVRAVQHMLEEDTDDSVRKAQEKLAFALELVATLYDQTFCLFSLGLSGGSDKRSWRGLLA